MTKGYPIINEFHTCLSSGISFTVYAYIYVIVQSYDEKYFKINYNFLQTRNRLVVTTNMFRLK